MLSLLRLFLSGLAPYTGHVPLGFMRALETSLLRSDTTSTLTKVTSIKSACRQHPIPTDRDYGPIKSLKLILNHSAACGVLHHKDALITNPLNGIVENHKR